MKAINYLEINFLSHSYNESLARSCIAAFLVQINPTVDEITDIKTAVSEAVTNCVVHAYPNKVGKITIQATLYEDSINIKIFDNGIGIKDISKAREPFFTTKPDQDRSGMGFTVMESFMDKIEVSKNPTGGICVEMTKRIGQNDYQKITV